MTSAGLVLVTGTSRGLGAATAASLLGRGFEVVGVSRRGQLAPGQDDSPRYRRVAADSSTDDGRRRVVEAIGEDTLHGVVLNAGVSMRTGFEVEDHEGLDPIRHQLEHDLEAPLVLLRDLLRAKAICGGSNIVFVSSNLAGRGLPGKVAYAAAKAGLEGACRSLACELGPRGIRVNAVSPGLLRTHMTRELDDAAFAQVAGETPLRRVGEVEDIAGVIAFFLSDDARHVTGQVLVADGGWSV